MSAAGIPVCAHLGLLPQRAMQEGGYFARAELPRRRNVLLPMRCHWHVQAQELLLLEAVPDEVTAEIVKSVEVPVLGCGTAPAPMATSWCFMTCWALTSGLRGSWTNLRMCRR